MCLIDGITHTYIYHQLFMYMGSLDILDADDEIHFFCLHYIFIPRINNKLNRWVQAWNSHPLRTENKTPY